MTEFDPSQLEAGKTYITRNGTRVTLTQGYGDWLICSETKLIYSSEETHGNMILAGDVSADIEHDMDIIDFAPDE